MKNLIYAIALTLFSLMALADIGNVNRSASFDATGALQTGSSDKYFLNVKNQSGGALTKGAAVILDVSNDDSYSVTTSTTAGAVPHCIMAEACAASAVCICQTYGYADFVDFDVDNGSATAGEFAFISETYAGYVQAEAAANVAITDNPIGVFYDSPSASGDVELFIKLR